MTRSYRVRPGYVRVEERNVHWHVVGEGRPLVMLHASPGSGKALLPLAQRLQGWQVLLLDTPGCGRSDPLAIADPSIDDYADATLEALSALGVRRCALFGTHTGAKIALAAAHKDPGRFSGLVLDGLGVSTPEEREDQLAHYTPRHEPVSDGSHLVGAWHQVRDMALFWPWYDHRGDHRLVLTPPSPERLHETVVDMLRNIDHYALPYRAAFRHDPVPRLASSPVPTLVCASADDPLQRHLERVTQAALGRISVDRSGSGQTAPRILEWLDTTCVGERDDFDPPVAVDAGVQPGLTRTYLAARNGEDFVHITYVAPQEIRRPPLVALHACPGSGRTLEPLAERAGRDQLVVLPDLPGLGASNLPGGVELSIEALGSYLGDVLRDFVGEPADLYGTHTGAAVVLDWADSGALPARSVLLDGMMLEGAWPDRSELLQRYAEPLPADAHGLHLLEAWHRVRDMMLFWPWYRHHEDTVRVGAGLAPPRALHSLVVDLLAANCSYHHLYRAAFRYRAEERLHRLAVPAILSAQPGDPLGAWLPDEASFAASVAVKPGLLAGGPDGVANVLAQLSAIAN